MAALITLGEGADVLTGTYGGYVFAGTGPDPHGNPVPVVDTERDTITIGTGGGVVTSGSPDAPNADVVDFAGGNSRLQWSGTQGPGGSIAFGGGRNALTLSVTTAQPVQWKASAVSRSIRVGGPARRALVRGRQRLRDRRAVRSAQRAEGRRQQRRRERRRDQSRLPAPEGGDDEIVLPYGYEPPASVFSAGGGRDRLVSGNADSDTNIRGHEQVRVDLDQHRLVFGSGAQPQVTIVNGIEDLYVGATRVRVHGDEKANEVFTTGCDIRVYRWARQRRPAWLLRRQGRCPLLLSRLLRRVRS